MLDSAVVLKVVAAIWEALDARKTGRR